MMSQRMCLSGAAVLGCAQAMQDSFLRTWWAQ
jgi:hypothetical protein